LGPDLCSYIVAKDLIGALASKLKGEEDESAPELVEVVTLKGKQLEGTKYKHPLYDRESSIVIGGEYITTESGTGLVHTAPGHGTEDYQTGLKVRLGLKTFES
jgi:isoleucyl-tRNA synthetase